MLQPATHNFEKLLACRLDGLTLQVDLQRSEHTRVHDYFLDFSGILATRLQTQRIKGASLFPPYFPVGMSGFAHGLSPDSEPTCAYVL
jgi:hypothetical protein